MSIKVVKTTLSANDVQSAIWCGDAGGTANDLTLAFPQAGALVDGMIISFRTTATSTGACTLAITNATDTAAKSLRKGANGNPVTGNEVFNNSFYLAQYRAGSGRWHLISNYILQTSEITALLSLMSPVATGGTSTAYTLTDTRVGTPVDKQVFGFVPDQANGASPTLAVNGGTAYPLVYLAPINTFTPLAASTMSSASAVLVRYDAVNTRYVVIAGLCLIAGQVPATLNATSFSGDINMTGGNRGITANTNTVSVQLSGGSAGNGGLTRLYGVSATNYGGANHQLSGFVIRANSTASSICPAVTGSVIWAILLDSTGKKAFVSVDHTGTVTFGSSSHADYVPSSSPASGEVGVYVSGQILYVKPGSAGGRSIAAFVVIGI